MSTFTVTITGHPTATADDIVTNLTFVHNDWTVTATEIPDTADPMPTWDALVRELYAKDPALAPFSRKPIPYETAAQTGARSAYRAQQKASEELGIAVVTLTDRH